MTPCPPGDPSSDEERKCPHDQARADQVGDPPGNIEAVRQYRGEDKASRGQKHAASDGAAGNAGNEEGRGGKITAQKAEGGSQHGRPEPEGSACRGAFPEIAHSSGSARFGGEERQKRF